MGGIGCKKWDQLRVIYPLAMIMRGPVSMVCAKRRHRMSRQSPALYSGLVGTEMTKNISRLRVGSAKAWVWIDRTESQWQIIIKIEENYLLFDDYFNVLFGQWFATTCATAQQTMGSHDEPLLNDPVNHWLNSVFHWFPSISYRKWFTSNDWRDNWDPKGAHNWILLNKL